MPLDAYATRLLAQALITALAPVFAAALVIQQFLEIFDGPISGLAKVLPGRDKVVKSYLMSFAALGAVLVLAWQFELHVFEILLKPVANITIPT
jgi:hypothetical protein